MVLRRQSSGRKSEENAKREKFWRRLSSFSRYYLLLGLTQFQNSSCSYCFTKFAYYLLKFGEFLEKKNIVPILLVKYPIAEG